MLRINVRGLAKAAGYRNAKSLADALGLSYNSGYKLWRGQSKHIALMTLEKICFLLDCLPSQIIEYAREPLDIKPRVIDRPKPKK